MTDTWRPVGKVPPKDLGPARLQAHNAVQWVARLSHSFLAAEADDRHLDLVRDEADGALVGRDIGGGIAVGFDVAELVLQFRENGRRSPHRLEMDGRSPAEVEAWFLIELLHRLRDRDRFSKTLPFEIAGLMSGDNVDFVQEEHAAALAEIAAWQANAAGTLGRLTKPPGAIISSPLHFDVAVVLSDAGGSVRAGLAPGDERTPEPYFYVGRGAALKSVARDGITRIGKVATRDLVADALPISDLKPGAAGEAQALAFLEAAVAACRRG